MKKLLGSCAVIGALAFMSPAAEAACRGDREVARIDQVYRGHSVLRLRQELGLIGRDCRGEEIDRVFLVAWSNRRGAEAWLEVNGRQIGPSQYIGSRRERVVFDLRNRGNELGDEIRTLQLHLDGVVRVERVGVVFNDDFGEGRGRRVFLGETGLMGASTETDTIRLGRDARYSGLSVEAVDDDFYLDRLDVYFRNGGVESFGGQVIREGGRARLDFNGRDRNVVSIVVRGRRARLWGTDARLAVYGIE